MDERRCGSGVQGNEILRVLWNAGKGDLTGSGTNLTI